MKIQYIYVVTKEYKTKGLGVNQKVESQVKELNRGGVCTELKLMFIESGMIRVLPFSTSTANWMKNRIWENYQGLYLRYPMSDFQLIRWFRAIKAHNPNFKIVVELPTYPYDEELKRRNKIIKIRDLHYRKELHKFVDRLVVNAPDDIVFGIPTIKTANGIDLDAVRKRQPIVSKDGTINMCMVAQFAFWHGADRLLKGLQNYYKDGGKRNIVIHLIGGATSEASSQLHALAEDDSIKKHVIFHGFMSGEELARIYDSSQLAVASLGLHRLKLDSASTLKSREYLARGIPFIYSSNITEFEANPVDFALKVSTDEKPVNFEDVLLFYDRLMANNDLSNLTDRIRDYAAKFVSIQKTMEPIEKYFVR